MSSFQSFRRTDVGGNAEAQIINNYNMSIQSITSSISSIDREIYSTENQMQTIANNITRKEKEAHSIMEKIQREKDLKRMISYQKDLTRKNEEINRLQKDKSTKNKSLTDKQSKRLTLLQSLNKEEQRDRDKIKREQKEMLSVQQGITREMERQKMLQLNELSNRIHFQHSSEMNNKAYDVFVSHASEDKEEFVRPFVTFLKEKGVEVWYDEFELRIGDRLRRSIDNGLKKSRFGIVVLSESFFNKEWPQVELDGLFAREIEGEKVILPIWHNISKDKVRNYSPTISDILAINTASFTIEEVADQMAKRILE